MALTLDEAKQTIDSILNSYQSATSSTETVLTGKLTRGKMYEAWVLSILLENFRKVEGYDITLVNSDLIKLKSSPGKINRSYAHFQLTGRGKAAAEVWTDVEFATYSHSILHARVTPGTADRHELDIVVVPKNTKGWPRYDEVLFGVECKNTSFEKHMMRAALGVRRELSLLSDPRPTAFKTWPSARVSAHPPSVLSVYSTDAKVVLYHEAGQVFGISFIHEPMYQSGVHRAS